MDLDALKAFLAVAEHGSFLKAADELYRSRTTLRRQVEALEARAGTDLFERRRSGVTLTAAGQALRERGQLLIQETEALLSSVRDIGKEPAGTLQLVLPAGLPPQVLAPIVALLRGKCPRLAVHARTSDDPTADLFGDVDVAISLAVDPPAGPWLVRDLMEVREWLIASEGYLSRRGCPKELADLAGHTLLAWQAPSGDPCALPLIGGGTFRIEPAVVTADIHALHLCAEAGLGLAFVPDAQLASAISGGSGLIPVLPELIGRRRLVRFIVPAALVHIPKIKAALEIVESFVRAMPRDVS